MIIFHHMVTDYIFYTDSVEGLKRNQKKIKMVSSWKVIVVFGTFSHIKICPKLRKDTSLFEYL